MAERRTAAARDAVFDAVADPMRRTILQLVVDEGPLSATAMARRLPITRQGVAKHLAVLEDAALVTPQRTGREVQYAASLDPLDEVATWVARVSDAWDSRLRDLDSTARARARRGRAERR